MTQDNKSQDQDIDTNDNSFHRDDTMIEQYVAMSIDPKQNPIYPKLQEIVNEFGNINGQICVDFGTGPGIMVPMLSNAVGEKGKCIGIDIDKKFLKYCTEKVIPTLKHQNVTIVKSKVDDICLSNNLKGKINIFLLAFVVNYLQEKDRYKNILSQIYDYLSNDNNAMVVVIDFDQVFVTSMFGDYDDDNNNDNDNKDNNDNTQQNDPSVVDASGTLQNDVNDANDNQNTNDNDTGYQMNWKYLEPEQIVKLFETFGFVMDRYILKDAVPHHHCLVFKKGVKK